MLPLGIQTLHVILPILTRPILNLDMLDYATKEYIWRIPRNLFFISKSGI